MRVPVFKGGSNIAVILLRKNCISFCAKVALYAILCVKFSYVVGVFVKR